MSKAVYFLSEEDVHLGSEPAFYNNSDYEWVKILENNWEIIKNEMLEIIEGREEIKLTSSNPPYLSDNKAWKNIYFYNFLWKYHKNCNKYPKTYALLKSIPNLTFAEFTVLEPYSKILPHIGETNATIRGHLGIVIPYQHPEMGICVNSEERGWQDGKVVLFSDSHIHHVWNNSDKRRFILVFDVVKDEFANHKNWVCAQSLGALSIKWFDEKYKIFKPFPRFFTSMIHKFFSLLWYIYLPIQRRVSFL